MRYYTICSVHSPNNNSFIPLDTNFQVKNVSWNKSSKSHQQNCFFISSKIQTLQYNLIFVISYDTFRVLFSWNRVAELGAVHLYSCKSLPTLCRHEITKPHKTWIIGMFYCCTHTFSWRKIYFPMWLDSMRINFTLHWACAVLMIYSHTRLASFLISNYISIKITKT